VNQPADSSATTARVHAAPGDTGDFSVLRYAQCWEDADVLLQALAPPAGGTLVSIASGGDNTFSLLTTAPAKIIAIDISPAQLSCVELKMAAYRELSYEEMLEFFGVAPSDRRMRLYRRIRSSLSKSSRMLWDGMPHAIAKGIIRAGKFDKYVRIFSRFLLPLVHSRKLVRELLRPRSKQERYTFYDRLWDSWRWRGVIRLFFSRFVSARLGRDPSFFDYVEGDVGERALRFARRGLTELDPSVNPYLHWITLDRYLHEVPHALRPESFESIRSNLDRLELRCCSIEDCLAGLPENSVDGFNLSDIFEYTSAESCDESLRTISSAGKPGSRVVYWNTFVPRRRSERLADCLHPLKDLSERLHQCDKVFFYDGLVIEEVL